jgi:uncharacterized protein involved in copper resistance
MPTLHGRRLPLHFLLGTATGLLSTLASAEPAREGLEWRFAVEQLEWQDGTPSDAAAWDLRLSAGSDTGGLRVRNKGGRHIWGAARNNRLEVLWGQRLHWWRWAGARLHYRIGQRVAPYVGVEWFDLMGDTASQTVAAGEAENEVRAVAGLRMEFGGR